MSCQCWMRFPCSALMDWSWSWRAFGVMLGQLSKCLGAQLLLFSSAGSVVLFFLDGELSTCNNRLWEMAVATDLRQELGCVCSMSPTHTWISIQHLEYCQHFWIAFYEGKMETWDLNKMKPNMVENYCLVFQTSVHRFFSIRVKVTESYRCQPQHCSGRVTCSWMDIAISHFLSVEYETRTVD